MDVDKRIGQTLADQSAVARIRGMMKCGDKSAHVLDKSITSPPERVLYRTVWLEEFVNLHYRPLHYCK